MKKKSKAPLIIIIGLLIVIGIGIEYYFLFSPTRGMGTTDRFSNQIIEVVDKNDADKFLKMFPKNQTESPISKLGAKSIVKEWHKNESSSAALASEIMDHGLTGGNTQYEIHYVEPSKFQFFNKTCLTTKTSKLIVDKRLKHAKMKVNGVKVSYDELTKSDLFPGDYSVDIVYQGYEYTEDVIVFGNGKTEHLGVQTRELLQSTKSRIASYDNDPDYVSPVEMDGNDVLGTWDLVESEHDMDQTIMPGQIDFSDGLITKEMYDGSVIEAPYSGIRNRKSDVIFISGPASPGFEGKLVKKKFYGNTRVALQGVRQGAYGWYLRE